MKLATFAAGGSAEFGVVLDTGVLSLSRVAPRLAPDMTALIACWPKIEREVRNLVAAPGPLLPLKSVRLMAPIPRPGKILAIGLNYRDHIEESGMTAPARPVWFCKMPTAANGPYDPIPLPVVTNQVDYEAELVAVVGQGGRSIAAKDAPAAVFGFACGNDVSAREWQMATSQWFLGKSFDGHAPFGPWIVTADEAGNPHELGIRSFVNGEKRQDSNTRHLVFNVWQQIAYVSQVMTLEPGDLIFTGTPGGVGLGFKPPKYLKDGDVVRIEIDRLGALEAVCRDEE
jgi:ureidoglycolate lyase